MKKSVLRTPRLIAGCLASVMAVGSGGLSLYADGAGKQNSNIQSVSINASTFPDPIFRSYVSSAFDSNGNGVLDEKEIEYARDIYCQNMGIESLKGIEYLTELRGLYCMDNQIATMDLSNNKLLQGVWCSGNKFTYLDFSPNPELMWVYCHDNQVSYLNVSNNPKMAYIECNTNPLKSLDVSHNPELEHLMCGSCQLTSLDLTHNPKLGHLDCFRNPLKSLDLTHNPKLKRLDIWDIPGLNNVDISHNPELQTYNCAHNDVVNLDVSHNPELTKLVCSYNDIKTLDLSHNPKLCILDCACNEISTLDISNNPYMHFLQAFTNPFTKLNIGDTPFLLKTYNEGEKKAEYNVGQCHSWTIDFGGDDSTGGDSKYFLCFDDKVSLSTTATKPVTPVPDPDANDPAKEGDITREMAVQALYEMNGSPDVSGLSTRFKDVQPGAWYANAVIWGDNAQICVGYPQISDDNFGVGKCLRRQDLALLLMRYSELKNYKRAIDFGRSDEFIDYFEIDYYAWEAVTWAITWNIMEGKGPAGSTRDQQIFDPHGKVTIDEFKLTVQRMLEKNNVPQPPKIPVPSVTPRPTATPAPKNPTPIPGNPTATPTPSPIPSKPITPAPGDATFEDFVERLYTVALNRASEPEGKAYWVKQVVDEGKTGADCARYFLLTAPEFMKRNLSVEDFVETLYKTFFDRKSDPAGKKGWVEAIKSGKKSRAEVVNDFIESTEWCDVCATYGVKSGALYHKATRPSKNAYDFATRLYTCCLKRDPEGVGLNYWSLALTNLEQTGASAAQFFFEGDEFVGLRLRSMEYIRRLYTTFMDREPDEREIEYWVDELHAGNQTRKSVLAFFAQSPEFTKICKRYGIDRGSI